MKIKDIEALGKGVKLNLNGELVYFNKVVKLADKNKREIVVTTSPNSRKFINVNPLRLKAVV